MFKLYISTGVGRNFIQDFDSKSDAIAFVKAQKEWDHFFVEHDEENNAVDIAAAKNAQMDIYSIEPIK